MPDRLDPAPLLVLTGATGFIGRRLQTVCLRAGYRVRALVRPESKNLANVITGCEPCLVRLSDPAALSEAISDAEAVVYCAGAVRGLAAADFASANVKGVEDVAQALERLPSRPPLLLISSLAASHPELSHYAKSKFMGEQVLRARPGLAWTILRPPAVYGPGDRELKPLLRSMRRGIAPVPGPPNQRLSLLHVDDLGTAVIAWLNNPEPCEHRVYSIDDGRAGGYDWPAIVSAVSTGRTFRLHLPKRVLSFAAAANGLGARVFRYSPMLTRGKVRELRHERWLCDNSPFTSATGWVPTVALEQGVNRLFEPS